MVTVNNVQMNFNTATVTFLQGCDMAIGALQDAFRLIEDSDEGVMQSIKAVVKASGNEDFTVDGSVKNALTLTLLPPYKMQFEAGAIPFQSAVGNLLGTFLESAGAIVQINNAVGALSLNNDAIEYSSYGERVSVDLLEGMTGVEYPSGNMEYRVDNFIDAVTIAWEKGFNVLELRDDNEVDVGHDISKLKMRGISHLTSTLYVGYDAIADTCIFENLHLKGFLDGDSQVNNCVFEDVLYFNGHIHGGAWAGRLTLAGSLPAKIDTVSLLSFSKPAILDCGGGGQDAIINSFEGMITVENLTNPATIGLSFRNGQVTLDATCTDGVIILSGNYLLVDNSGVGCTVISKGKVLVQEDLPAIATTVLDLDAECV